jgi:predicted amidohydrolase
MNKFIVAAAQFPAYAPDSWEQVELRLEQWVEEAAAEGARLLVFPEYAAMSLAALFAPPLQADLNAQIMELQTLRENYLALHRRLAGTHGVYILAGSFPWAIAPGRFHNRAWLVAPEGRADFQDKLIMTRFEREEWNISSGTELKVFETALGRIGINVCYDVEFPLLARAQVEAGAMLILAPSCTDTLAGYHRVRIGAQARALENQCIVVQAPLVGEAPWSPAIDINVGAAGVYAPPDRGFPCDGVLASGRLDEPGWVYAALDPARIEAVRSEGQVLNQVHWPEQLGAHQARAQIRLL